MRVALAADRGTMAIFSKNVFLEFKFRLFLVQAAVGVFAVLVMSAREVHRRWNEEPPRTPRQILEAEMAAIEAGGAVDRSKVKVPMVLWWTPSPPSTARGRIKCGEKAALACNFVRTRRFWRHPMTKAVIFRSSDLDVLDLLFPRNHGLR